MQQPIDAKAADLCDRVIERYVAWREAYQAVHKGYEQWSRARRDDAAIAFLTCAAELDCEELAVNAYADSLADLSRFVAGERGGCHAARGSVTTARGEVGREWSVGREVRRSAARARTSDS